MKFSMLGMFFVLCACISTVASAADPPTESSGPNPLLEIQNEADSLNGDTVGVGTEGYGSPIQSLRFTETEFIGAKSGYFHPFLSVGGVYTDNLFNTSDNEKSDYAAVITPGIWLATPATRQKLVEINTMNMAPGGLALSRFRTENDHRFQGYALYRADFIRHDKYTDENRVNHRAEGLLRTNLRGGLSLELLDIYEVDQDPYGTGGTPSREMDKFTSNLANVSLGYQVTPKVSLEAVYGNYYLDYNANRNQYRNRTDNSVSLYAYYKYSPKTSIFLQGEWVDINYDEKTSIDREEFNYFIGAQLNPTAKTRGRVKIGYGRIDYDPSTIDTRNDFLAEGQFDYFFTPKTSAYLRGYRRVNQSDIASSTDITAYYAQLGYRQRFTAKLRGEAGISYTRNNYDDNPRKDDYYGFVAALGFTPLRWLNVSLGYEYKDRDSNLTGYDYSSNSVFLRLTAAL